MIRKVTLWYLKRMLIQSKFEEESLEINADLIDNVNEIWQNQREISNAIKLVIKSMQ